MWVGGVIGGETSGDGLADSKWRARGRYRRTMPDRTDDLNDALRDLIEVVRTADLAAVDLDATISEVVDKNCDGCAYCIDPCPYNALTLIEYVRGDQIKKTGIISVNGLNLLPSPAARSSGWHCFVEQAGEP